MRAKAAILETLGLPLVVAEVEVLAPQHGQVLVRVHCSGVCGTQIGEINGWRGNDKFLPHLLGHEGGGVVVAVGPGVRYVKPDDHVVMHWRAGRGIESDYPKYIYGNKTIGGGLVTTFNEYALVSENRLTPIAKNVPFEIAALMGCCVTTGLGLIRNEAQMRIGQSIAVYGCGGVGLNIIQGAAMAGAWPIIGIDNKEFRIEMARGFGATHIIDSSVSNVATEMEKIVGSDGVDVFAECTGIPELIEQAYELTGAKGKCIMVGVPRFDYGITLKFIQRGFLAGKILMSSQGGSTNPTADIPLYLRLYQAGMLMLNNLITHRFTLEQINEALTVSTGGSSAKCIVEMK